MKAIFVAIALGVVASPAIADDYITLNIPPPANYLAPMVPSTYELPNLHYHCWSMTNSSTVDVKVDMNKKEIHAGQKTYPMSSYIVQVFKSDPRAENEPLMIFSGAYTTARVSMTASGSSGAMFVNENGGFNCRLTDALYSDVDY
jgi:hypothetical protein